VTLQICWGFVVDAARQVVLRFANLQGVVDFSTVGTGGSCKLVGKRLTAKSKVGRACWRERLVAQDAVA
jgi:hypothetical protein